jgi:hypothetical protein
MNPNETPEFGLEDILDEFSDPTLEDILKEFSEPEPPAPPEPEPEPEAPGEPVSDATAVFTPVEEADAPEDAPIPPPRPHRVKAEPFSDDWEPEYDQPMGEFTPQNPIPFPEKSRLRQLRQKLVAGPERRYQALCEAGIGQLQAGVFLNFLLALLSVAATVATVLGAVGPERLRTVVFCQLLLAMLSALVGCYRMLDGVANLFKGRFTLDATLLVTFLASIADGLLCLSRQQLSASSLFCLQILMAQWAAYQRRNTELSQMDVLRKANELHGLAKVEDLLDERPGYITVDGEPEDFLEQYQKISGPEKALSVYGVVSLLASFGLAVACYLKVDLKSAIQVFMAAQLVALPFSAFVSMSRPEAVLQARLHRLGAVICGWRGIRAMERRTFYPLSHDDLFPEGSIKLGGVKFYGTVDPARVVSYTTALLTREGSGLLKLLRQLPRSRAGANHTVEDFTHHPGGISGQVDGFHLLIGTAQCMDASGVTLPSENRDSEAIFTAVEGQLCGVFSLTYHRAKSSTAGIRALLSDRRIRPVVMARDFSLTPKFLRDKLAVNPRRIRFPQHEIRLNMSEATPTEDAPVVALTINGNFAPKAYALTGARALKSALRWGSVIHILGGTIGLIAVGVLALNGGIALLSPENLLLYSAIWSIPGLLTTEKTKYL